MYHAIDAFTDVLLQYRLCFWFVVFYWLCLDGFVSLSFHLATLAYHRVSLAPRGDAASMSTGEIVGIVEDRCLDDPIYKHPSPDHASGSGATVRPPEDSALTDLTAPSMVRQRRAFWMGGEGRHVGVGGGESPSFCILSTSPQKISSLAGRMVRGRRVFETGINAIVVVGKHAHLVWSQSTRQHVVVVDVGTCSKAATCLLSFSQAAVKDKRRNDRKPPAI